MVKIQTLVQQIKSLLIMKKIKEELHFLIGSLLLIILTCQTPNVFANVLALHSPTPGGIAVVQFALAKHIIPKVTFMGSRVLTMQDQQTTAPTSNQNMWLAVVGIPLSVKPGTQYVQVHTPNGVHQAAFTVRPKTYRVERITIPYKGKGKINPAYELKVLRELKEIEATYRTWADFPSIQHMNLQQPVFGRKSSTFGLQRVFNGVPKSPHSGLDIAAPEGTPVKAARDGVVIRTSRYCLTGNAIFLDHGQGFITAYFHLQRILVKPGDHIKQGKVIGIVGRTGRVTGPHLHWSVSLNGVRVDPELFLAGFRK